MLRFHAIANQILAYSSTRSHSQRHAVSTNISLPLMNWMNSCPFS
ncbi:hypothetical protein [Nostoc edaphicum]|nr:hypothetical protein [Nostoc edaphicum]